MQYYFSAICDISKIIIFNFDKLEDFPLKANVELTFKFVSRTVWKMCKLIVIGLLRVKTNIM